MNDDMKNKMDEMEQALLDSATSVNQNLEKLVNHFQR